MYEISFSLMSTIYYEICCFEASSAPKLDGRAEGVGACTGTPGWIKGSNKEEEEWTRQVEGKEGLNPHREILHNLLSTKK